jgi:excisionase family DNA binding protein
MEPLKSIEQAAETLGLSPWTIRRYVQDGKIRPVRIGRRVLIETSEIERVIEEGRCGEDGSSEVAHDLR